MIIICCQYYLLHLYAFSMRMEPLLFADENAPEWEFSKRKGVTLNKEIIRDTLFSENILYSIRVFFLEYIIIIILKNQINHNYDLSIYYIISFIIKFLINIIMIDFLFYVFHFCCHYFPFLYKHIHKKHHNYLKPNIFDTAYMTIYETFIILFIKYFIAYILNINYIDFIIQHIYISMIEHAGHTGLNAKNPLIPSFNIMDHENHHKYLNCNYGKQTNFFDKLFGTYYKPI